MKKLIAILVTLAALVAIFYVASASGLLPEGVQEFYNDCGYVCYVWPDGSGDCYPCVSCNTVVATDKPKDTPVPPTEEPTLPPPPKPTEKPKCNRGLGNGSENCDPGNSYGQGNGQGRQAGEDRNENKKDK